jgi:cytoskeletal protein RodZ
MPASNQQKRRSARSLLIGGLLLSCATVTVLASGLPEPTFLESGSNDLIRFQKGEVPAPAVAPEPAQATELDEPERRLMDREEAAAEVAPPPPAPAPSDDTFGTDRLSPELDPATGRIAPQRQRVAPAAVPKQKASELETSEPEMRGLNTAVEKPVSRAQDPASLEEAADADDAISARLVTVCLTNPDNASGAKGFDIRRDGPPRYVADVGATACAQFEPTRHTIYLWKTNDLGALSLILSSRLDLVQADGTQVSLDWLRDR